MYEIAKYHMKKDIDVVLKWQLNYNKSLKDLNTIFYDLSNFEKNEIQNKTHKLYSGIDILNYINEKTIPELKLSIRIMDPLNNKYVKLDDINNVDEIKNIISENIKNFSSLYSIVCEYNKYKKSLHVEVENYKSKKSNEKFTDILKEISIKELLTYQTYGNTLQGLKEKYNNLSNHIREYLNKKMYHNRCYIKVFNSLNDFLKVNFDNLDGNLHFNIYSRNKNGIHCKNINEFINTIKKDIKPSSVIKIELEREKNNNDNIPNETFIRGFVSSVNLKYVKNMDIKAGFNDYVWSHGLDGHNNKNIFTNAKNIVDNPKIELCCSFQGKEVGTVGLYVKGDCRFASVNDINSFIEAKTGYRKVNIDNIVGELFKPEDIFKYEDFVTDNRNNLFTEGIVNNIKIVGIWIEKIWYSDDELNSTIDQLKEITGVENVSLL